MYIIYVRYIRIRRYNGCRIKCVTFKIGFNCFNCSFQFIIRQVVLFCCNELNVLSLWKEDCKLRYFKLGFQNFVSNNSKFKMFNILAYKTKVTDIVMYV